MIKKKFDELRLTGALPSPSSIGLKILELTKDEDYDQAELARTIKADPALSGRVIRLGNSALHNGGAEPASSVDEAAMRLGAKAVRTVALGFTLISDNRSGASKAFDYDMYWSRALASAVACNTLACELESFEPTEAFTCALLCDVGMLALASVHPERYSALLEACPGAEGLRLAEVEEHAFDINHYEVTAAMMEDWGLPLVFQNAVLQHELGRESVGTEDATALVKLLKGSKAIADLLVHEFDEESTRWCANFVNLREVAEELGMEHTRLLHACDAIGMAWESWGQLIGVPSMPGFSFVNLADQITSGPNPLPIAVPPASETNRERLEAAMANPSLETDVPEPDETTAHPMRILLIDDDQRMLKLISHHLKREGYDVSTAESSERGLQQALECLPQIVITDWMMPGMTGVKLCETLRQSEPGRKMYVLIVTAREDDERVVEAFAAGVDDYIVKPFNPRILLARVRAGKRMIHMREQLEAAERVRLRQVAELGILTRKLRAAAMTDALTELPNRRYAMKRLKQEWESSIRTGRPVSVILGDIDFFKSVNDQYGHDTGDAVLREVANALRTSSRSGDILCRLGGEEFLSINLACSTEEALLCGERLREAVETLKVDYPGLDRGVTLSLGVAERTADMECVDDLIKLADEALYEAKSQGRNCVVAEGKVFKATPEQKAPEQKTPERGNKKSA